ncbi:MAG: hypothetical protein ACLRM8_00720 [Alistipes sp.]
MKRSYSRSLRSACFRPARWTRPLRLLFERQLHKTEEDAESGLMYAYNALN